MDICGIACGRPAIKYHSARILFKDGEWRDVPVDGQRVINHRILKRMSVRGHNAGLHDIWYMIPQLFMSSSKLWFFRKSKTNRSASVFSILPISSGDNVTGDVSFILTHYLEWYVTNTYVANSGCHWMSQVIACFWPSAVLPNSSPDNFTRILSKF